MTLLYNDEISNVVEIMKDNIKSKYECILQKSMEILRNQMLDKIANMNKEVL
jgi:hypothetical protein